MSSLVRRLLRGIASEDGENQNANVTNAAKPQRRKKASNSSSSKKAVKKARPGSGQSKAKSTTPVVIPPWSYSLREVKEKVQKRDGLRRRAGTEDVGGRELRMGDVEGLWTSVDDPNGSEQNARFLPIPREEERLERLFEKEGLASSPLSQASVSGRRHNNNPFGRGSYRAKKSMGEARWREHKEKEAQQMEYQLEILEERYGKRFVRECQRQVYAEERTGGTRQGDAPQAPRQSRRLNVGVPVGQARKRPSTAEGALKQPRVEAEDSDGDDGWRIVASRPLSG